MNPFTNEEILKVYELLKIDKTSNVNSGELASQNHDRKVVFNIKITTNTDDEEMKNGKLG